ncbi:TetR/AcrR family transcriptional regulator [Streptomyces longispororuber]|uniref:TetR/AcrR family transcriptional regulator n=1 Tax=Streptomyces longispororuber TaxID=68230 RepID=UPI00210AD6D4|nr:TetR/AcrR family transcriptional regulator [Streptomyces longispororuber]MCQ4206568.1 TetR/AcrR family transcriptional regulator [Streptomyces longispororuber]
MARTTPSNGSGGKTSEARTRLVGTATRIFYAEGIHSVGVDRIIAEAQVTRATLYRHFSGKEDLVLAYLDHADRMMRGQISGVLADAGSAVDAVRAVARAITDGIQSEGFRGCAFLNAVSEYPDPAHPVHRAVLRHRQWFLDTVTELLARIGDAPADADGRHLVMLRDGAMAAGCLFDPALISGTFLRGIEGIVRSRVEAAAPVG